MSARFVVLSEAAGMVAYGPFVTRDEAERWAADRPLLRVVGVVQLIDVPGRAVEVSAADEVSLSDETRPFPPIGDTVRRRPPVPPLQELRELRGAELLRALVEELEREGDDL